MTSSCISILDLLSVVDICETYRISDTNISAAIVRSVNQWTLNICSQFGQYVRSSNTDLLTGKYRVVYEYFACSQCLVYLPDKGFIYTGACVNNIPDSKVHGAIMGPILGRQDPGGPHVDPMNLAIWDRLWTALKTVFTYRGLMKQRCVKVIRHQKFCNCLLPVARQAILNYNDVIMGAIASNHQPHDCLLNRLFRRRSKKTSKLRVTGLCVGNSPGADEFPAQMASYAENISIWWRHHAWSASAYYQLDSHQFFSTKKEKCWPFSQGTWD